MRTERLVLRPCRVGDAEFHHRLWEERDPRVPTPRRIGPDGRPTVSDLEVRLRDYDSVPAPGLLVVELHDTAVAVGYCGLVANSVGRPEEPELAYEFLRAFWNLGYATEAAEVIVRRARLIGYQHLAASVRQWNTASLRVLEKLGFVDTGEKELDDMHGDSLLLRKTL